MSFVGNLLGKVVGGITGANQAADAAQSAASTQSAAAQAGIDEQQREFDAYQQMLKPFVSAGSGALTAQQDLLGLNGAPAQQTSVNNIESMPYFQGLVKQGENGILANASATGGLRGGNVQAALGQFQPQLLASLIQQQFQNLGGLTSTGANAASGVGSAGMNTGQNIAQLLQQKGAATAGGQIAAGSIPSQTFGTLLKLGALGYGLNGAAVPAAGATPAMVAAGQF